jgi:microcystin-dependent protein
VNNLDLLIPTNYQTRTDSWTWATVTAESPLRIRLDGDTDPLPATPESLVSGLSVGQRVWVQLSGHRVIVHAPSGGVAGDGTPVGVMQMWPTSTPPENYLILDGSTFDQAVYPDLYAVLGTNVLPDLRQRFPMGGTLPTDVGAVGGSDTISEANLPPHTHDMSHDHGSVNTGSDGSHNHSFTFEGNDTTTTSGADWRVTDIDFQTPGVGQNFTATTGSNGSHSHTVDLPLYSGSTGSTGSGTQFLPPYFTVNFIIKAK